MYCLPWAHTRTESASGHSLHEEDYEDEDGEGQGAQFSCAEPQASTTRRLQHTIGILRGLVWLSLPLGCGSLINSPQDSAALSPGHNFPIKS